MVKKRRRKERGRALKVLAGKQDAVLTGRTRLVVRRKNLYQRVYEYDLPIVSPEPKVFEFVQPYEAEADNPWKDSFKMLVSTRNHTG